MGLSITANDEKRFDALTDSSGDCWEWQGSRTKEGYGKFYHQGGPVWAHRFAYEREYGDIPKDRIIMHGCNNPGCVNPSHLLLGSYAANTMHSSMSGTHPRRKLTVEEVQAIRLLLWKIPQYKIAKQFNVSQGAISMIARKITFIWIPDPEESDGK